MTSEPRGPRPFVLIRHEDVSGVSGTGVVAEGVEFADGTVALRWLSQWPTSVVFHDRGMDAVQAVHGHGGATEIRYTDDREPPHQCDGETAWCDSCEAQEIAADDALYGTTHRDRDEPTQAPATSPKGDYAPRSEGGS